MEHDISIEKTDKGYYKAAFSAVGLYSPYTLGNTVSVSLTFLVFDHEPTEAEILEIAANYIDLHLPEIQHSGGVYEKTIEVPPLSFWMGGGF